MGFGTVVQQPYFGIFDSETDFCISRRKQRKLTKHYRLTFCVCSETIEKELAKYRYDEQRVEIINLPDVIAMDDIATEAIKRHYRRCIQFFLPEDIYPFLKARAS